MHRPITFTVTFVAMPGVDGIKAFRALLKTASRRFGLRAIDAHEIHNEPPGSSSMSSGFTADDKLKAVRRELAQRRSLYPRWILERRITQNFADEQIAVFAAIVADYEREVANERLL